MKTDQFFVVGFVLCARKPPHMYWVRLGLITASLALSGCVTRLSPYHAPQKTLLEAERVEVPFTFNDKRPAVEVMINGKGPYRFIVDTGSDGTAISSRVAVETGITVHRQITSSIFGATADYENVPMAVVRRIDGKGFSLQGIAVVVWSSTEAWGEGVDGLLGISTLGDVVLEIDYPRQKVCFSRPGIAGLPISEGVSYSGLRPQATLSISGETSSAIVAVIDTGAHGSFALRDIDCFSVRGGLVRSDTYFVDFGGGMTRPRLGQLLGEISCGPAIWRDPAIAESRENRIGSEALRHWKLVVDQKKKLLWLDGRKDTVVETKWVGPAESDGRPAVYGFACVPDGEAFLVKEVDPGSRAERSGLRVGDRYTWQPINQNTGDQKQGDDSFAMRLHVRRGSEDFETVISLWEPLMERLP